MKYTKHGFLRYWYMRLRYHKWFEHREGIKGFAEQVMYWLITSVIKQSRQLLAKLNQLKLTRDKLIKQKHELLKQPLLDNDEYFSIRKKIISVSIIVPILIVAETFLNYISTLVIFVQTGFIFLLIRWAVAIVLTAVVIVTADETFHAISPVRLKETPQKKNEEQHSHTKGILRRGVSIVLLVLLEITIVGIAEYRARDVEGGVAGSFLYYSFIILAGVLPLVVGYLRWDKSHYYDAYTNRSRLNAIEQELKTIDQKIAVIQLGEHFNLKNQVQGSWALLSEFRVYKEIYNHRKKITENLNKHFTKDKESFQKEARRQYEDGLESAKKISPQTVLPTNGSSQHNITSQKSE
ncbi:MAG: hypothetical protein AAF587_08920 [Bacteroidota bacterium]